MVFARFKNSQIILVLFCLQLLACNYHLDRAGEVTPVQDEAQNDPAAVLDFAAVQQAVFTNHCQQCHSLAGQFTFENYEVVLAKLGSIENRVFVSGDMPPRGMPENAKAILKEWIQLGAPL